MLFGRKAMTALNKSNWPDVDILVARNCAGESWAEIGRSLNPPASRAALLDWVQKNTQHSTDVQIDDMGESVRHRTRAMLSDDSFVARMQKAIKSGRERVAFGPAPRPIASGLARYVPLSVAMSYCSSPAAVCVERGDGERWNPRTESAQ
jgi:hypothetical protein